MTADSEHEDAIPLVDELGVVDLRELVFGKRGKLFSAAGRFSPVAEFTDDSVLLHPPDKPLEENGPVENIAIQMSERGVLLDELGAEKKIPGATFQGNPLWILAEQKPDTDKYCIGWFDESNTPHKLYLEGEELTTEFVYKLRNRTHDGELSCFDDISSDNEEWTQG